MPVPEHDDFRVDAAFLATGDKGISKLVGVMIREKAFESGTQLIDVDVFGGFEIYDRLYFSEHRGKRYISQSGVSAHAFLAGFTFEHVVADNFQRCKFALPKTEIKQDEQCACDIVFAVSAVFDERFFFGFCERATFFAFVIGQDDFLHGRGKVEIFGGHIENAAEREFEFLCRSVFSLGDEGKEILLNDGACNFGKHEMSESGFEIGFKHAGIFPEGGILCRLLFDAEPIFGIIGKEDGSGGTAGRSGCGNILCLRMTVEFFDEFLFHGVEIFGSDFDVVALFAVTGLEQTVVVTVFDDAVIVNERLLKGFGHIG